MSSDNPLPGAELAPSDAALERGAIATYEETVRSAARPDYGPAVWKYTDWIERLYEADERREVGDDTDRLGSVIHSLHHTDLGEFVQTTPEMVVGVQLLKPGEHAEPHRHNSSAINFVVQGSGYSIVDGEKLEWDQYDTFLSPPWDAHEHVNDGDEDAIIYTIQPMPLLYHLRAQMWQEGMAADVIQQVTDRPE